MDHLSDGDGVSVLTTGAPDVDRILRANLDALTATQPQLPARIRDAGVPVGAEVLPGRDGVWTWRWPGASGRNVWLGQSSMPGVSSQALFGHKQQHQQNLILPGILTGAEPHVILLTAVRPVALFVIEPDLQALRMALSLYDFTAPIDDGRLILMHGDDIVASMCHFYELNPGYEFPRVVLRPPQISRSALAVMKARVEEAGAAVRRLQEAETARVLGSVSDSTGSVMISTLSTHPRMRAWMSGACRAVEDAGIAVCAWSPELPSARHVLVPARSMRNNGVDHLIGINGTSSWVPTVCRPGLKCASWFLADPFADVSAVSPVEDERYFAASPLIRSRLTQRGVPGHAITMLDQPADCSAAPAAERVLRDECVLVMANVAGDDPATLGLELSSQRDLAAALRAEADAMLAQDGRINAERILQRAEARTTPLKDVDLRGHFLDLVRSCFVPAARLRAVIRQLVASRMSFEVFCQRGWTADVGVEVCALDGPADWWEAAAAHGRWIVPAVGPADLPIMAGALACRCEVDVAGPCPSAADHPQWSSVVSGAHWHDDIGVLMSRSRRRSRLLDRFPDDALLRELSEEHSIGARIRSILSALGAA